MSSFFSVMAVRILLFTGQFREVFLCVVFVNAPDSFLWFVYEPEIEFLMRDHWMGKGILLLLVTGINGVVCILRREKASGNNCNYS